MRRALALAALAAAGLARAAGAPALEARLTLSTVGYEDSNGVRRLAPRVALRLRRADGLELSAGGGASRLEAPGGAYDGTALAALALTVPAGPVRLSLEGAGYDTARGIRGEGGAAVALPRERWRVSLGWRYRPLAELAPPLAVDEQAFYDAGTGGATDLAVATTVRAHELRLAAGGAPAPWAYVYLDARGFALSDGNRGGWLAAGAGADLVSALAGWHPLGLVARWDAFLAGYARREPAYWSPASVDAHGLGGELRLRGRAAEISAGGGATLQVGGSSGWYAGGGLRWRLGPATVTLRLEERRDPWYRWRHAWVAVETPP